MESRETRTDYGDTASEPLYPRHASMTSEELSRALVSTGDWLLMQAERRVYARLEAIRADEDRWLGLSYEDEAP